MPVNIHGKQYVTVNERTIALHADWKEGLRIETEIVGEDEMHITIKATVTCNRGVFTGHARSDKTSGSIEGQSPLEVGETSAVGRALGFAGYGIVESISSADEVTASQSRSPALNTAAPVILGETECEHGRRHYKKGEKDGKPWSGEFCPVGDKDCKPSWLHLKKSREQLVDEAAAIIASKEAATAELPFD